MNWFIKFLLVLSVNITFAQQEASVWYFGHNAGLKFEDNGTVTPLYGELFTNEGCSSIADTNGNLLLYTDGMTVYDRNHLLMPNGYYAGGTGLMGDKSSTQSAIIVPKPGDPNIYYVFTIDEPHHENGAVYPNVFSGTYNDPNSGSTPTGDDGVNNGLNYSEVDLTIIGSNGSIGDVVSLNNHLVTYDLSPGGNEIKYKCSEKITAVKDTNGSDYWVITHFVDKFMAFRITSAGVNPTPVISTLMPIVPVEGYRRNSIGYMKASPNGEKIAIAHNQIVPGFGSSVIFKGAVYVYDFDASTGIVSNPELVAADVTAYGVEFSSSSEKLYTSFTIEAATGLGSSRITQFDLTSTNIPASGIMIYDNVSPGALQIAPNGKIYFSGGSNVDSLGVINDPDLPGSSCNFVPQSQPLLSGTARVLGLPPFITSFFYPTFSVENFCEGMSTQFLVASTQNLISTQWDFGDGTTSTDINPIHQYAAPGTYTVVLNATMTTGVVVKTKDITIYPMPVANPLPEQLLCGTNNQNYNLAQNNPSLLGTQSSSLFGINYYGSLSDATAQTNALGPNFPLPIGTTTFHAMLSNLESPDCNIIQSFDVTLFEQPVIVQPSDYILCEIFPHDGIEQFDLNSQIPFILNNQPASSFVISFHSSLSDAQNDLSALPLVYTNTAANETLFVRVEHAGNDDCFSTVQLNLIVLSQAQISVVSDFEICDDISNDGLATFDLTVKTAEILNGQSPLVYQINYYLSNADAQTGSNEILAPMINTANNQPVFYTISIIGESNCKVVSSFNLVVSKMPVLNNIPTNILCDDTSNDGFEQFDLSQNNAAILGSQNASDFSISYYLNQTDAINSQNSIAWNYQNISNPQTIFVRIENALNSSCFTVGSFQIIVSEMPIANSVSSMFTCDDESNNNTEVFDLSSQNAGLLNGQSAALFDISYYNSFSDAENAANPLPSNFSNTSNPQTIYATVTNNQNPDCYDIASFQLVVHPKPVINLAPEYILCEGSTVSINAQAGFSSYLWSNGSTSPNVVINQAGNYTLQTTLSYGSVICESTQNFVVTDSNIATISSIDLSDWTDNNNTITINVTGTGQYEYSLDGNIYQESNQFSGLLPGLYNLYVNDMNGCGLITEEVFLLMYPHFFTPNGDGFNDLWHIKLVSYEPGLTVEIYDRYGKFITNYTGMKEGWDGTLNGEELPSSDYWFVVKRVSGKEYRGHFSLKR